MKVAAAQFLPGADVEENLARMDGLAHRAALDGARLVVFSEEAMVNGDAVGPELGSIAQENWPGFSAAVSAMARRHDLAVVAGGYEGNGETAPYNTLLAVDARGEELGSYRKMHLYDAFSYQESNKVTRGDTGLVVITVEGFAIGLVNCYDLRFPELSRLLVERGADVLSVSAAWVAGPLKEDHWSTLLRARAIENTAWVVASGVVGGDCIGLSTVVDPLGVVRGCLGEEKDAVLVVDITKDRLDEARSVVPVLRNRRIMIEGS